MTFSQEFKKQFSGWSKKQIIGMIVFVGFVAGMMATMPIEIDHMLSFEMKKIADAKTCTDIVNADVVNFGESMIVGMFDTNGIVVKSFNSKAHELCKPLYDMQKKYGDLKLSELSKMSCDDLGTLIHTVPAKQEVINEYVSRCEVH